MNGDIKKTDDLLDLLEIIHKTCIDKALPTYDDNNIQTAYMFVLYSNVVELLGDSYQAVKFRKKLASHVLTRALLEAVVELFNVINNPDYMGIRLQNTVTVKKNKLKLILEKYSDLTAKMELAPEDIKEILVKIEKLHVPDIDKKYDIKKRFEDAGMERCYHTVYPYLCNYSHHDPISIINRPPELKAPDLDKREIQLFANLIISLILKASIAVHESLKSSQINTFKNLQQKWHAILCSPPHE